MKFLAPLWFGLALITGAPAAPAAQCRVPGIFGQALPGCPAASWFGLAIDGVATTGGWWTNGLNRVLLFTGEDPSPEGGVTLNVPSALFPPSLMVCRRGRSAPLPRRRRMRTTPPATRSRIGRASC